MWKQTSSITTGLEKQELEKSQRQTRTKHTIVTFPIRARSCVPAGKIFQMETVRKHSQALKLSSFILQNIPKENSQVCISRARTRFSRVSWITLKLQKQPKCPPIRDWVDKWREFTQWHVI